MWPYRICFISPTLISRTTVPLPSHLLEPFRRLGLDRFSPVKLCSFGPRTCFPHSVALSVDPISLGIGHTNYKNDVPGITGHRREGEQEVTSQHPLMPSNTGRNDWKSKDIKSLFGSCYLIISATTSVSPRRCKQRKKGV
jgi:hypothetical protein